MLKSSLCGYSDAYILVKETIPVDHTSVAGAATYIVLTKRKYLKLLHHLLTA